MCAAAEPADDAAAALHEQKKGAGREADAARRRPSRAADATATLRCVWNGLCAARCVMYVGQAAAHVLCLVAPEMSGGPSLRCQYGIDIYCSNKYIERPSAKHILDQKQNKDEAGATISYVYIYWSCI